MEMPRCPKHSAPPSPSSPPLASSRRGATRRQVAARLTAQAAGLALAACGPQGPAGGAAKPDASPANLQLIAYTWGQHVIDAWNASLNQYMARHPHVKVEFIDGTGYGKAVEKVQVLMAGGQTPDLAMLIPDVLPQW